MKKVLTLIMSLLLMVSLFTGCELTEIDAEADGNQVIATVNGAEILKKEWLSYYNFYKQYYSDETQLKELGKSILEMLVSQKIWELKAQEEGYFDYTDEQRAAAKEKVEKEIEEDIAQKAKELKEAMVGSPGADEKDYTKLAREQYERDMKDNGDTVEKRIEDELRASAMERFKEDKLKDIAPLEADIIKRYDELKKQQNETITEKDKAKFVDLYNDYLTDLRDPDNDAGTVIIKSLSGYIRVQHILIAYKDEDAKKVSELYSDVEELKEDISDLEDEISKETDETKKEEKQAELDKLKKDLEEKQAELDEAMNKASEAIMEKANEALNKVKGKGEDDFIKVMLEYTDDPGMKSEAIAKQGYLVGDEDNMVSYFHDAALKLENAGDISDAVKSLHGIHIIRKIDDVKAETKALEGEVKDRIVKILTKEQQDKKWQEYLETWTKEAKIKRYTKKLK